MSLPCGLLAIIAAKSAINDVKLLENSVEKRRRWYADLLRIPGNFFLWFRKAPVRVLSSKAWRLREKEISNATLGSGCIRMKKLEGTPLDEYLISTIDDERKSRSVFAAVKSLFSFHTQFNQSHGDASATNVMIVESSGGEFSATWFDFDVAHTGSSEVVNFADDLRALLYTSIYRTQSWQIEDLRLAYPDEDVWAAFAEITGSFLFDIFHQAQMLRAKNAPETRSADSSDDSSLTTQAQ